MKDFTKRHAGALIIIPLLTLFHVLGVASVPFHPDETSLLYQSRDLEIWLTHPWDLAYQPGGLSDDPQDYRALNAPLPKYILGVGRRLAGFGPEAVSVDWDWTLSWTANVDAGALPDNRLLAGARTASSLLICLTLLCIYGIGVEIGGRWAALLAVVLAGTNALVLLHARRAMAEGTLLVAVSAAIWGITQASHRPWAAGVLAALAFAAKQSAAPLALVGLAAAVWPKAQNGLDARWKRGGRFLLACLALTAILQPFFWAHPVGAARAMLDARRNLLASQIDTLRAVAPEKILDSPAERTAAMLGEVFIIPPQLSEAGNYLAATAAQDSAYLAHPLDVLGRGFLAGGLMLALTLIGLIFSLWPAGASDGNQHMARRWLAVAGLAEAGALLWATPLPFQRYYLPLVPFVCLWASLGVAGLGRALLLAIRPRHPSPA